MDRLRQEINEERKLRRKVEDDFFEKLRKANEKADFYKREANKYQKERDEMEEKRTPMAFDTKSGEKETLGKVKTCLIRPLFSAPIDAHCFVGKKQVTNLEILETSQIKREMVRIHGIMDKKTIYHLPTSKLDLLSKNIPFIISRIRPETGLTPQNPIISTLSEQNQAFSTLTYLSFTPSLHKTILKNCNPFQLAVDRIYKSLTPGMPETERSRQESTTIQALRLILQLVKGLSPKQRFIIFSKPYYRVLRRVIWAANLSLLFTKIVSLAFRCLAFIIEELDELRDLSAKTGIIARSYGILATS